MEMTAAGLERLIAESTSKVVNDAMRHHKGALDEMISDGLVALDQPQGKRFKDLLAPAKTGRDTRDSDGIGLLLRCFAAAGGDLHRAKDFASKLGHGNAVERVQKALGAGDATGGGFLIEGELSDEIIDALRARSAVRSLAPMSVLAPRGTFSFPRLDTSASRPAPTRRAWPRQF